MTPREFWTKVAEFFCMVEEEGPALEKLMERYAPTSASAQCDRQALADLRAWVKAHPSYLDADLPEPHLCSPSPEDPGVCACGKALPVLDLDTFLKNER
jgi:hypothetical protein